MANHSGSDPDAFGEFGVPVHIIQKSRQEQIRIGLNEFHGRESIHIRSFYDTGEGFRPTRRGVTVSTTLYPELLRGVLELGVTLGVIDPDVVSDVAPSSQGNSSMSP